MPKRSDGHEGVPHSFRGQGQWSIDSNSLTPDGQAELLKQLGRQLQANYQTILKEPTPERLRELLERLEESDSPDIRREH